MFIERRLLMFNFISQKLEKTKLEKIERHKQLQRELEEREKEERKRTEELNKMVEIEMDKYLNITLPAILLHSRVKEDIYSILKARGSEITLTRVKANIRQKTDTVVELYDNHINVFIELLESKGYKLKGNEKTFIDMLESKIRNINYEKCMRKFGDSTHTELKEAFFQYIDVFVDDCFKVGAQDFLSEYLFKNNLTNTKLTVEQIDEKLKDMKKLYDLDFKVRQLENRLNNSSNIQSKSL